MNVLSWLADAALVVGAVLVIIAGERDRARSHPHRFGIGIRGSHLRGTVDRPWRWMLHPLYSPDAIDVLIGTARDTALSGRTRTHLGAMYAGHRARKHLEHDLELDREEFVRLLHPDDVVQETNVRSIFPPEIRGRRSW